MMAATFFDVEQAFQFVSAGSYGMNQAFLSLDTGRTYYLSGFGDSDELPDDFDESDRYVEIPHQNDLGLGRRLVDEFTAARAQHLQDDICKIFRKRGAYARFKSLLSRNDLLDDWHEFQNFRETEAIKQWCRENGVLIEAETDS